MDWVAITVGVIFLLCIISGLHRGAIRIAVSLVTTIITLLVVFFATPYVADAIAKYTPLDEVIEEQIVGAMSSMASSYLDNAVDEGISAESVQRVLEAAGIGEEQLQEYGISVDDIVNGEISGDELAQYGISSSLLDGLNEKEATEVLEEVEVPRDAQIAAIENADLPDVFKSLVSSNNNTEYYKKLGVDNFAQYVGSYLTKLFINIAAFLCTFLLVTIVLRAIIFALDFVSDLPVLGFVNRLAGGFIGVLIALVIVWFMFMLITLMYTTDFGKDAYEQIHSNGILKVIYEYNPILKLATTLR